MQILKSVKKYNDLIYDVGMHKGEDSDYYLRKGFKVIAFEANPLLIEHCRKRFPKEIENGRLTIIEGAIVEPSEAAAAGQRVRFYKNKSISEWGTLAPDWAHRNEKRGTTNEVIEVKTIDFAECLVQYGMPYYLKIDIEGLDTVCLRALLNFEQKPSYVSIESDMVAFDTLLEEFGLLEELGYSRFKAIQQEGMAAQFEPGPLAARSSHRLKFQEGSSGPFAEELMGEWKDKDQIVKEYKDIFYLYGLFGNNGSLTRHLPGRILKKVLRRVLRRPVPGWYDTHAKHATIVS